MSRWDSRDGVINLSKLVKKGTSFNAHEYGWPEDPWTTWVSENVTINGVPSGEEDEEVNMPWFDSVDKKIIQYDMHNADASIVVVGIMPEPQVLEIWDAGTFHEAQDFVMHHDVLPEDINTEFQVLAHRYMVQNKKPADMLASLKIVDTRDANNVLVKSIAGQLPSRTIGIRRALLFWLAPVYSFGSLPVYLILDLFDIISPFLPFLVIWLGCIVGLVVYRRMQEGGSPSRALGGLLCPLNSVLWFVGTLRRRGSQRSAVWGPAGPVDVKTHRKWFDEEKSIGLERPQQPQDSRGRRD